MVEDKNNLLFKEIQKACNQLDNFFNIPYNRLPFVAQQISQDLKKLLLKEGNNNE